MIYIQNKKRKMHFRPDSDFRRQQAQYHPQRFRWLEHLTGSSILRGTLAGVLCSPGQSIHTHFHNSPVQTDPPNRLLNFLPSENNTSNRRMLLLPLLIVAK